MGDVVTRPRNEVIHANDLMALSHQPVTEMRTDEAGGSRYEYSHYYRFYRATVLQSY